MQLTTGYMNSKQTRMPYAEMVHACLDSLAGGSGGGGDGAKNAPPPPKPAESKPKSSEAPAAAAKPKGGSFPPHQVLNMPALSPTMSQGNITEWKKKVGAGRRKWGRRQGEGQHGPCKGHMHYSRWRTACVFLPLRMQLTSTTSCQG